MTPHNYWDDSSHNAQANSNTPLLVDDKSINMVIDENADYIRNDFASKVFTLTGMALCLPFGASLMTTVNDSWRDVFASQQMVTASFICLGLMFVLNCCQDLWSQKSPLNVIMLGVMSLLYVPPVGFISAMFTPESVVLVMGATIAITFLCAALAKAQLFDITSKALPIFLGIFAVSTLFILVSWIFPLPAGVMTIWHYLSAGFAVFYLVWTFQMILGKGELKFTVDEAVMAANTLLSEIISLFINLLSVLGSERDD